MVYAGTFFASLLLLFLLSRAVTRSLSHLFYRITKSKSVTIYLLAFLFFPGTVIHELSHFLMAALLFVPVGQIDLWPKIEGDTVKLGSVQVAQTDIFRRFLIGAAPFLFGVTFLLAILFYAVGQNLLNQTWFIILMIYIAFEIGNTMFSSKKDMEGALELFGGILFIVIVFYFLGVRIPSFDPKVLFDHPTVMQVFQQGSLFLLVPLGIDILVLLLLRLFSFKRLQ